MLEADENERVKIKIDENSDIKWVGMDKAVEITKEERMKPIYQKLNQKMQF